jgi:hypothetical protein
MLLQGLLEAWLQVWLSKVVLLLCNVDALARATKTLIQELETRFPAHGFMDVLGIVYPKYWLQTDRETYFPKQLSVLAKHNCWMGWKPLCLRSSMLMTLIANKACSS